MIEPNSNNLFGDKIAAKITLDLIEQYITNIQCNTKVCTDYTNSLECWCTWTTHL